MVAIKIDKNFVAHNFRLPCIINESILTANIALLDIGQVCINDNLDFFVDPVLQDILDFLEVVFRQLYYSLSDIAPFTVPVGYKVVTLVL